MTTSNSVGTPGDLALDVGDLVNSRQERYGDVTQSWSSIADAVETRIGLCDTTELCLWVLVYMKFERDKHSPENRDHLRDAIGYLTMIDHVRRNRETP